MGVLELAGVKAELAKAVKSGVMLPLAIGAREDVCSFTTIGVEVEMLVTADKPVAAEGFDDADGLRDFHGVAVLAFDIPSMPALAPAIQSQ